MSLRASVCIIFSLVAGLAIAQGPGKWQTTEDGIFLPAKGHDRGIIVKKEGGSLAFVVSSPQYLRDQAKTIKAMFRFDSAMPKQYRMKNVERRMAVVTDAQGH